MPRTLPRLVYVDAYSPLPLGRGCRLDILVVARQSRSSTQYGGGPGGQPGPEPLRLAVLLPKRLMASVARNVLLPKSTKYENEKQLLDQFCYCSPLFVEVF